MLYLIFLVWRVCEEREGRGEVVGSRPWLELSVDEDEKWAEKGRETGRSVPSCSNSECS